MARVKKNTIGKRAVIYARYSSHNQRDVSIEQQYAACEAFAAREGYIVEAYYADRAVSGKTDNRLEFQRMMKAAHDGDFDFVISWKSNRMGRNMIQAMLNETKLLECGVRCLYVEEDFDDTAAGRFALRNMMNVNQFYIENMAEDVRRGMMDNAKKCMVNGKISYGFRKGKDGKYEIIPEEAAVIREIFNRVIDGWLHVDIMTDLNNRGIRTKSGKEWKRTSLATLLRNEQYIGVYQYAEVRIEGGIPAILDRKTFEEVQTILTTKKNPRGKRRNVEDYMLTGKLFCGHCGNPMVGICGTSRTGDRYYYYLCQGKHRHECDKKNERKEQIEQYVINVVKQIIMDEETIDWIEKGYQEFVSSLRAQSTIVAMEKELVETEKAITNLIKAIELGIITDTTKARMVELEAQKKELERSIRIESRLLQEIDVNQLRYTIELFRDKNIEKREYQRELINTFIKAVYVYDDHLTIVLNRSPDDNIEIPFADIAAVNDENEITPCVRMNDTKGYHLFITLKMP